MYFKNTIRNLLILFIAVLIIVVIVLLTCHHSSTSMQGGPETVDTSEWVNNAGDITHSLTADPSYFAKVKQEIIDSMAKVYKTTPKKIIEYITIHEQGESDIPQNGSTAADYMPIDSAKKDCPPQIKSLVAGFKNDYYTVDAKIAAPGSGDTSSMHISSKDSLTLLWKWVKEGNFFHRTKKLQFDISNANPDNRIYVDNIYRITEKPKKWGVGGQAGVGFFGSLKPTPYLGIGISYNPIRF